MATAELATPKIKSLGRDPVLGARLHQLRQTDNWTNWYFVLRTYAYLAAVIGGTIWFYHFAPANGISPWFHVPVTLVAIVLIGAGQHQLTGLAHEASHHILFRNRYLNDLVSDWLCMFPMFSSTHHYRLQHLAHHQFVNDPVRDPDVSQLQRSGHWLDFPLRRDRARKALLRQLWIPNLIRYIRIRARYNSVGTDQNPYLKKGVRQSKLPVRVGVGYLAGLVATLTLLVWNGSAILLAVVPTLAWVAIVGFYGSIPASMFHQSRVHPVISSRTMTQMRMTFLTLLFTSLAWITLLTGEPAALYFFLLWLVPIFTSFSLFMVWRQIVQHGNGGRGWLTNTRVFLVQRFLRFAVFPMGQDYHLPHHIYATVPHYNLKRLHEVLLQYPEYQAQAVVVEGYFVAPHPDSERPTVVDVLGPAFAPATSEIHIDNSVLDDDEVEDREQILLEGELEQHGRFHAQTSTA